MKTNTVTLFLSTGIVIEIPRLSNKKLDKLIYIIGDNENAALRPDLYHIFKHEGSRYYIKPNEVSLYVLKSEKVHI